MNGPACTWDANLSVDVSDFSAERMTSMPEIQIEEMLDSVDDKVEGGPPLDDHLRNLKALTEKLRLETRRPSYLEWKAQLEGLAWKSHPKPPEEDTGRQEKKPTEENISLREVQVHINGSSSRQPILLVPEKVCGFGNIDEALNWLRKELVSNSLLFFKIVYQQNL